MRAGLLQGTSQSGFTWISLFHLGARKHQSHPVHPARLRRPVVQVLDTDVLMAFYREVLKDPEWREARGLWRLWRVLFG